MWRAFGDDELGGRSRSSDRHVDGDPLLEFGLEAVGQQREVDSPAPVVPTSRCRDVTAANGLVDLCVVQQTAEERDLQAST